MSSIKAGNQRWIGAALQIAIVLGLLPLLGCMPIPQRLGPESGALAISVVTRWATFGFDVNPDFVLFIQLEKGESATGGKGKVWVSNYRSGNLFFLLNAPPGRYAAIAATEILGAPGIVAKIGEDAILGKARAYTTFFPEDLLGRTEVEITPGAWGYLGSHLVTRDIDIEQAGPVQLRLRQLTAPTVEKMLFPQILYQERNAISYRGRLTETRRDAGSERALLTAGLEKLEKSQWAGLLRARLAALEKKENG